MNLRKWIARGILATMGVVLFTILLVLLITFYQRAPADALAFVGTVITFIIAFWALLNV